MQTIADAAYYLVSKKPVSVILVILATFIISFGAFSNVEMADDFESGIADSATVKTLTEYKLKFGSEQQILIAFPIDKISATSVLRLFDLVAILKSHQQVKNVISALDLLRDIKNRDQFKEYLKEFRLKNLKKALSESKIYRKFLISEFDNLKNSIS